MAGRLDQAVQHGIVEHLPSETQIDRGLLAPGIDLPAQIGLPGAQPGHLGFPVIRPQGGTGVQRKRAAEKDPAMRQ